MRNMMFGILAAVLLCAAALAQTTTPPSTDPGAAQPPAAQPTPQTSQAPTASPTQATQSTQPATSPLPGGTAPEPAGRKIAPGTVIPVQLTKTVDAKKAKMGDEVVAKVAMDLKTQSGEVMVPKDTKVFGHVTEAQARTKEQKESQLAIAFDRAVTKDGTTMQLPMSVQAIIGEQNNQNPQGGSDQGSSPTPGGTATPAARSPMGSSSTPPPNNTPAPDATRAPSDAQSAGNARPPINEKTQGVIGISNIALSPNSNASQGSMVTSDKNNVKLESGTMLLLRVNQ